jgi:hypothetical protein
VRLPGDRGWTSDGRWLATGQEESWGCGGTTVGGGWMDGAAVAAAGLSCG